MERTDDLAPLFIAENDECGARLLKDFGKQNVGVSTDTHLTPSPHLWWGSWLLHNYGNGGTHMAEKNTRYSKNEKNADTRGKKQTSQQADHRRANNQQTAKNQKSKPMTAAAAASHKAAAQAESAPKTSKKKTNHHKNNKSKPAPALPVRYTVLGGLNEIGKNMAVLEYGNDAIVIDCGMSFPDEDLLGVDVVLPDFSYLLKIQDKIRGVFITHGHEDHIGALPYLLKQLDLPVYSGRLTVALIGSKLKEHGLANKARLHVVEAGGVIQIGKDLSVEFVTVNHSIPDAMALAIKTPQGYIVHTGDFKVDFTPVMAPIIDLPRFGELGREGVLALLADSTNAERAGYTPSERVVGESFANLFRKAEKKRIIVATFSSNLPRIQQIMSASALQGRKVAVSGRSMINFVNIAQELGYLHVPEGLLIDIDAINHYPKDKVTLITTGSQGEPMSALTRMSTGDHRKVNITSRDLVIISAYPIPGNEKYVGKVVNELMKLGAEVVYEKYSQIHVSGHACQDEQKLMLALTKPRYFIPVHGEYKHLKKHCDLALQMGMAEENVVIPELGRVIELSVNGISDVETVTAGAVLVDGLGVGDVGNVVLRDRKHLGEDGIMVVSVTLSNKGKILSGPDILSRGFVYVKDSEKLINDTKKVVEKAVLSGISENKRDWQNLKTRIRDSAGSYLYTATQRSPMILPIITEISEDDFDIDEDDII